MELLPRRTAGPIDRVACSRIADAVVVHTGCKRPVLLPPTLWMSVATTLNQRGWKRLQRILGYCGQFPTAVSVYRAALEALPRHVDSSTGPNAASDRLRSLVHGTVPLIVGKGTTRSARDWDRGPVVRLNVLNLTNDDQAARCDVLYLNSGQAQALDGRLMAGDPTAQSLVARVELFNVGSGSLLVPDASRFCGGGPDLPFGGALTGIRAISDMLQAGAAHVHLVGFDFYLTAAIRKPNHEMCAQLGSTVIWGQLDWAQRLYRQGLVTADAAGQAVLEMSLEEYARRLEERYADWSAEIKTD